MFISTEIVQCVHDNMLHYTAGNTDNSSTRKLIKFTCWYIYGKKMIFNDLFDDI